jgi:Mg2+-importing ATPase
LCPRILIVMTIEGQPTGLSAGAVLASRQAHGSNQLRLQATSAWAVLGRQLNNPLLLILVITTAVSYGFGDHIDAAIILAIMALSVGLGFFNEFSSERTVEDLLKRVSLSTIVIRDGEKRDVPVGDVVVGDVILLHQGSVVPADLKLVQACDLLVNEATLTGEAAPAHKKAGAKNRDGMLFMGTSVVSGSGQAVVTAVAGQTEFGRLSANVTQARPKTDFQKGLAKLSGFMTRVILGMAFLVCFLNIALGKEPLQAVLFALSIAIGLTPALLPVITTVSMAQGAHRMAKKGVVVKRLVAIEDLGNMQVLCTDKTGTLTEGKIRLTGTENMRGQDDDYVLQIALLCNTAHVHHRVIGNPIDVAIWEYAREIDFKLPDFRRVCEEEFNYDHRAQIAVVDRGSERLLLVKGAPDSVLDMCAHFRNAGGHLVPVANHKKDFRSQFHALNDQGLRLVAVAQKSVGEEKEYGFGDAHGLELLGFLTFLDTPKHSAKQAIEHLGRLGVGVKIVTGDNELVTQKIAQDIGFAVTGIITGPHWDRLTPEERQREALQANVFARVSPEQKLEVIAALQKCGQVVGYMGDGINDAGALHQADVGLSVNTAVDVAKDTAGVVLLKKGLDVIADGVVEGRKIFANTIKYILMGTSSNFGNMFSVAGASFIFKNFLPLTPSQILLNNLLYDSSQLGIPGDNVDDEQVARPHHWDIQYIYRYMLYFGPISSVFDYLSFYLLYRFFHSLSPDAYASHFQTGWFLESIATQVLVVFVIRTSRSPFWKSLPGGNLSWLCLGVLGVALVLPFLPVVAPLLHFSRLPLYYFEALVVMVFGYLAIVELVKARFLRQLAA